MERGKPEVFWNAVTGSENIDINFRKKEHNSITVVNQ